MKIKNSQNIAHTEQQFVFFFSYILVFNIFFLFIFVFLFKNLINRGISRSKAAGILLNGKSLKDFFHRLNSFFQNFFLCNLYLTLIQWHDLEFSELYFKGKNFLLQWQKRKAGLGINFPKNVQECGKVCITNICLSTFYSLLKPPY